MRDAELIRRVQEGRPGAFDELYFAYVDRVHRHLHSIVGPDGEIEDLVQATFVQVFRHVGGYRGDASFATWLHRIVVNTALGHLRQRKRRAKRQDDAQGSVLEGLAAEGQSLEERLDLEARRRALYEVLEKLKPKKRVVFVLYEIEGHTLEEIGAITESSMNTVAARLRAARLEVRRLLERRLMRAERPGTRVRSA